MLLGAFVATVQISAYYLSTVDAAAKEPTYYDELIKEGETA